MFQEKWKFLKTIKTAKFTSRDGRMSCRKALPPKCCTLRTARSGMFRECWTAWLWPHLCHSRSHNTIIWDWTSLPKRSWWPFTNSPYVSPGGEGSVPAVEEPWANPSKIRSGMCWYFWQSWPWETCCVLASSGYVNSVQFVFLPAWSGPFGRPSPRFDRFRPYSDLNLLLLYYNTLQWSATRLSCIRCEDHWLW